MGHCCNSALWLKHNNGERIQHLPLMDLSNRDAKGGLGSKGYSHGEGNAVSSGAMAVSPPGATQLL